ncbi:MAG: tRNA (adenosine(37)-N6)-dimethylallyltransferase MiaA [Candidatus Omnitrophica bacterium]|nr:tRNA (adenosine(37)-N6)-dimethylallyltransferase MiaA [Candidatus Omnitrophota bacterium]
MPRIVALVGPTAVGKSAIAVELAQSLGAEIVSCDSMQVYQQMPILSQAPTRAQRAQVQHHLIDCIEPTADFSVGQYRKMAVPIIDQILARGKRVLIVGGTGLYLRAITEGLCEAPPGDLKVREQLWSECRGVGSATLHNRLQGVDATAASKIHPNDARRIIRALEVYALTGKPISSWWRTACEEISAGHVAVIGLTRDRDALYQCINKRLLHMIYEEGVINEVRELLGLPLSRTARQVHGLADLEAYLAGALTLKETITIWQQRVRNYAKRQLSWFRQTTGIAWATVAADERSWETSARLTDLIRHTAAASAGPLSSAVSIA